MGQTSTTFVHPLKSVVIEEERRDPVGHLVNDVVADREFRFVKMRGGETGSMGMPVFAYRLTTNANENTLAEVTVDAASVPARPDRDLAGILVTKSTIASGQLGYILTRGRLGKIPGGLYPETIFALTSAAIVAGDQCGVSVVVGAGAPSVFRFQRHTSVFVATSGGKGVVSVQSRTSLLALSTDVGDKIVKARFQAPHYFGAFPPNA